MSHQNPAGDEARWIEQAANGDEKAFRGLYESHVSSLYRFMNQFSKNVAEVEDWVQRAFISAFRHLHQFQGGSKFSSWLFRIAINEMRSDRRRLDLVTSVGSFDDNLMDKESTAEKFEWDSTLKIFLDQLDETKRMVFILYEVEGYSHAEIATMLGFGESTSRTVLSRTKQFLKKQWEQDRRSV
jgi:RNA polymerase sigma-70 factor (ECF subfamily)